MLICASYFSQIGEVEKFLIAGNRPAGNGDIGVLAASKYLTFEAAPSHPAKITGGDG
jgi:hypothetical protein